MSLASRTALWMAASASLAGLAIALAPAALGQVVITDGPATGGGEGGRVRSLSFNGNGGGFGFGMPNLLRPEYSKRDAAILIPALSLDNEQQYILELLLEQYTADFEAAAQPLRDLLKRAGPFGMGQMAQVFGADGVEGVKAQVMPLVEGALAGAQGGDVDVIALGDGAVFVSHGGDMPLPPGAAAGGAGDEPVMFTTVEVHVADVGGGPEGPGALPEDVRKRIEESIRTRFEARMKELGREVIQQKEGQALPAADPQAEQPPPPTPAEVREAANRFSSQKSSLGTQFVEDVKASLNSEQMASWPAADQKLTRIHSLTRGRFAGESIDLAEILAKSVPPAEQPQAAQDVINQQYFPALDAVLKQRDASMARGEVDRFGVHSAPDDPVRAQASQANAAHRLAIRSVNEQFTDAIAGTLTPEQAAQFRADVKEASFQRIFRPTVTQRSFKAAQKIENLDPAVKDSIAAMEQSYLAELAAHNERMVQVTREFEPREDQFHADMMKKIHEAVSQGQEPPAPNFMNPVMEQMQKRNALGRSYLERLKATLTSEQFESLPGAKNALEFARGFEAGGASVIRREIRPN